MPEFDGSGYFFDTSALVKRCHPETGTATTDPIAETPGASILISRLTGAELTSAFAIKVRTGVIENSDTDLFLSQFRYDVGSGKLRVFSIAESEFVTTERLIRRYAFQLRLRALDALQLAVALELRERKLVDFFVAADRALCDVAALEGFVVVNPEQSDTE